MATRSVLILLASCIFSFTSAASINQVEKLDTKITFVDNFEAFLKENPELDLIPLEKSVLEQTSQRVAIQYTFGRREIGDNLVAQGNKNSDYPTIQDIEVKIDYPTSGVGAFLTYIQIDVQQRSKIGQAYIIRGGIHQNSVSIMIEAKRTLYFNYYAAFYGR